MIEQIEDVRPELYLVAFGQFDVLHRYVCAEKRPCTRKFQSGYKRFDRPTF